MMIRVSVTAEDIAKGKRGSATGCPVAIAISRVVGGKASVGIWEVGFFGEKHRWGLPSNVSEWTARFDRGEPVVPIEFDLQEGIG